MLPGIQENAFDQNKLKVPDRELGTWVSSNPRGYADWFIAKANLAKESLLQKALRAERIPADNFNHKKPLQRAVQLIKRDRDLFFQNDDTYKTSSIILTTIAGQFYQGEESIFNTIDNIITVIRTKVNQTFGRLKILNPMNSAEDFTDKWDSEPEYYEAFKKFANHLYKEWQKLKMQNDILDEGIIMKGLFGDDVFMKAQKSQTAILEGFRKNKELGISRNAGILSSVSSVGSTAIKSNTFYGGE